MIGDVLLGVDGGPGPHLPHELRVQVQAVRAEPPQAQGQAPRLVSGRGPHGFSF